MRTWILNNEFKWVRHPDNVGYSGYKVLYTNGIGCFMSENVPYDIYKINPCALAHFMKYQASERKRLSEIVSKLYDEYMAK